MKRVLSLVVLLLLAVVLVACGGNVSYDQRDTLIVGLEVDYAPFNWAETTPTDTNWPVDGQNNIYAEGYDVAVARHIATQLGRKLVIKQIVWDSLIDALTSNEIDLIIAGMSPTASRKLTIDFTNAYYHANHVVVVNRSGNYTNITSLEGLRGSSGVGQRGTVYADLVDFVGQDFGATVLPVIDTVPLISNALIGGTADFTVVERPVALGMVAAFPALQIVLDNPDNNFFNVSDEDVTLSIGVSKENGALLTSVNTILAALTQETRDNWMNEAVARLAE